MNFNLIEGQYADLESIHDEFCEDYLWSNELNNTQIRVKYGLTVNEFNYFCETVKKEYGFSKRPKNSVNAKHYYHNGQGWSIQKRMNQRNYCFGTFTRKETAKKAVELYKRLNWNVEKCRKLSMVQPRMVSPILILEALFSVGKHLTTL